MRIKDFVHEHFKHFNAAALVDAAIGYEKHEFTPYVRIKNSP